MVILRPETLLYINAPHRGIDDNRIDQNDLFTRSKIFNKSQQNWQMMRRQIRKRYAFSKGILRKDKKRNHSVSTKSSSNSKSCRPIPTMTRNVFFWALTRADAATSATSVMAEASSLKSCSSALVPLGASHWYCHTLTLWSIETETKWRWSIQCTDVI